MPEHRIERITIHHTGVLRSTKRPTAELVRNLQSFSQSDGKLADGRSKTAWADVPYHFYVGRDGTIVEGRDAGFAGDTNTRYDPAGHLAIAVSGNYEEQELSDAQRASLVALVEWAAAKHDVPADRIGGPSVTPYPPPGVLAQFSANASAITSSPERKNCALPG